MGYVRMNCSIVARSVVELIEGETPTCMPTLQGSQYVPCGRESVAYETLARKQPSHVFALARKEPDGTPILLRDCVGFE